MIQVAVDRIFMEQAYQFFLQYFKNAKEEIDYDLLLSILLYLKKDSIKIDLYFEPIIYYENSEMINSCIDQLLEDIEIPKQSFLQLYDKDAEDYDDIIWDVFSGSLDFIYNIAVEPSNDDLSYYEERYKKIKANKDNIRKYSN